MTLSAEIISIGTEVLLGEIVNTNAAFLGRELSQLGLNVSTSSCIADSAEQIETLTRESIHRSDVLVFTGGLGPTRDDLTVAHVAKALGAPLEEDPVVRDKLEKWFREKNIEPSSNQWKQCLYPIGAETLPNLRGSAPGIWWETPVGAIIVLLPGVPSEMQSLWSAEVSTRLAAKINIKAPIASKEFKVFGGEGSIESRLQDQNWPQKTTVATYAGEDGVRIKLTSCNSADLISATIIVRQLFAPIIYAESNEPLASVVGRKLRKKGQTVATAESCTGGGIGQVLTAISGSSDYFLGGVIAYHGAVKSSGLQVAPSTLKEFGEVSSEAASAMASGAKAFCQSDWAIAVTGIAGPGGGSELKPVGTVWVAIAGPGGTVKTKLLTLGNRHRNDIRSRTTFEALFLLYQSLC